MLLQMLMFSIPRWQIDRMRMDFTLALFWTCIFVQWWLIQVCFMDFCVDTILILSYLLSNCCFSFFVHSLDVDDSIDMRTNHREFKLITSFSPNSWQYSCVQCNMESKWAKRKIHYTDKNWIQLIKFLRFFQLYNVCLHFYYFKYRVIPS